MSRKRVLTLDKDNESIDSTKMPKVSHLEAVKRIFRYIKGTQHLGLWYPKDIKMKQAFVDYNITLNEIPILCDDKCAINLTSSPIDYPRTKHIEIRHHFLKDNVAKKHITIEKIPLGENVANILTKPLEKDQFCHLRLGLGLMLQEEEEEVKGQDVIEECTLNN
ncbi:hypothetical protein Tco_0379209 [Tanacetum coccineum]